MDDIEFYARRFAFSSLSVIFYAEKFGAKKCQMFHLLVVELF